MLGQAVPPPGAGETRLERIADAMLAPFYPALERRAIETVKTEIGPYVAGAGVGLALFLLFIARRLGKRVI